MSTTMLSRASTPSRVRLEAVELAAEDPMVGGQFVLVVNRGRSRVDVNCWAVTSQATGAKVRVVVDRPLEPRRAYRLVLEDRATLRSRDRVRLFDQRGRVVDRTPWVHDDRGDDRLWYRSKSGDWRFGRGSAWPPGTRDGRLLRGSSC